MVLAVCADRVPAAVVIELRDPADRPRYDVRRQKCWIRVRDVGARGIRIVVAARRECVGAAVH